MTRLLERSIINCVIALALIATAILALVITETSSANTILAVQVFFWALLVYVIAYGLNIIDVLDCKFAKHPIFVFVSNVDQLIFLNRK